MNYFDKIIIDKAEFPVISRNALNFFREEEESIYQLFVHVFTHCYTLEDIVREIDSALSEVTWTDHSLVPNDSYTFEMARQEILDSFKHFFNRFFNALKFLKNPPQGVSVISTTLKQCNSSCYEIEVIYCENENAQHEQPYNPYTGETYTPKATIYTPYQ